MLRLFSAVAFACAVAVSVSAPPSNSASSSGSNVGVNVLSATSLDVAGCGSGVPGRTDFGALLPGTTVVTSSDCSVVFGSSNDTARLQIRQTDRMGSALWMPPSGALDANFDGPSGTGNGSFAPTLGAAPFAQGTAEVQPDGKVVVAGTCNSGAAPRVCLARFDATGALDPTFDGPGGSGNGAFTMPSLGGDEILGGVAVQPDGRILLTGNCGTFYVCLGRLEADGSLDTTFDGPSGTGNGWFRAPVPGSTPVQVRQVLLQGDGRLLMTGSCASGVLQLCVMRVRADGDWDPALAGTGQVLTNVLGTIDVGTDLAVAPDGSITASGACLSGASYRACAARYSSTGVLDPAFDGPSGSGNGAFALTATANDHDFTLRSALQPDGALVLVGQCDTGSSTWRACAWRLTPTGALDPTFDGPAGTGNGYFLLQPTNTGGASDVLLQGDGRMVVGGGCTVSGASEFCLHRLTATGDLDPTFDGPSGSGDGRFTLPVAGAGADVVTALAAGPDGAIYAAGQCEVAAVSSPCVAGFAGANERFSDYSDGGLPGDRDWSSGAGTSTFGVCLRAVSGGASAQWTPSTPCTATDSPAWHGVPATAATVAYTTALEPDPADATASLRFGLRPATNQAPGPYVAAISFDVVAP